MNIEVIHDHVNKLTNIEFKRPRMVIKQIYRSNQSSENVDEFFKISIFIPNLDSSLKHRFSSTHKTEFSLMQFHPENMRGILNLLTM